MAVSPNNSRGMGRKNPATGKWEVVSRSVWDRDVKSPSEAKAKAESRKVINTNPSTGRTRIGNLAGGAMGGMFGIKNR
jgi:hypothetical protein